MIARIQKAKETEGFTLIELLVVMIIIGILAAIAIPLFLSQREKAQDSAAKADVSTLGKEIATYFVDNTALDVVIADGTGRYVLTSTDVPAPGQDLGAVSDNVAITNQTYASSTTWCVSVVNPEGDKQNWMYSAQAGLEEGTCP